MNTYTLVHRLRAAHAARRPLAKVPTTRDTASMRASGCVVSMSVLRVICVAAAAAAAALTAACPPPAIDRDAGPDALVDAGVDEDVAPAVDYCESIVGFFCPYYLRCGRMAAESVEECTDVFLAACNARFEPSYLSLEAAGLLNLSRAGLAACEDHLSEVACDEQLLDLDGPCGTLWRGTQAVGEECGFDIESFVCAPGAACTIDVTFCGVCERVVADGERCDSDGVTCARESSCEDGRCVARSRVGEACGAGERCVLGAVCNADSVCEGPSYVGLGDACDNFANRCPFRSECIDDVCVLAVGIDDTCGAATPCDSGGFCDAASETCVELVPQGGACELSAECQTGVCGDGNTCTSLPGVCFPAASGP